MSSDYKSPITKGQKEILASIPVLKCNIMDTGAALKELEGQPPNSLEQHHNAAHGHVSALRFEAEQWKSKAEEMTIERDQWREDAERLAFQLGVYRAYHSVADDDALAAHERLVKEAKE